MRFRCMMAVSQPTNVVEDEVGFPPATHRVSTVPVMKGSSMIASIWHGRIQLALIMLAQSGEGRNHCPKKPLSWFQCSMVLTQRAGDLD